MTALVSDLFSSGDGATPVGDEMARGLKADWISTRGELNAAEQINILKATTWTFSRSKQWTLAEIATTDTLKRLHRRMFSDVWRWAGRFRQVEVNIGSDWWNVPVDVANLCGDLVAQATDETNLTWPARELAVRFHHRLVAIHPFPNGNGRHARMCADLIAHVLGAEPLSWGRSYPADAILARKTYLEALRQADREGDYRPLIRFAES